MKRILWFWILYVLVAVVLLPAWLTMCLGGFQREEVTYDDEVISAVLQTEISFTNLA